MSKIDMDAMAHCLKDVTASCQMDVTEDDALFASTIPSARSVSPAATVSMVFRMCNPGRGHTLILDIIAVIIIIMIQ